MIKKDDVAPDDGGHAMIRAGDLLHVLQPLAYVALLLAQLRGARCLSQGWRRRLPWLAAPLTGPKEMLIPVAPPISRSFRAALGAGGAACGGRA